MLRSWTRYHPTALSPANDSDASADDDSLRAVADVDSAPTVEPEPEAARGSARRGDKRPEGKARRIPATLWQRATYRWTAITAVMAMLLIVYTQHPYYLGAQFAPFRPFYTAAFIAWLTFGLFYVRATLTRFQGARYLMRDGGLHLLMLGKTFALGPLSRGEKGALAGLVVLTGAVLAGVVKPPALMVGAGMLVAAAAFVLAKAFQPRRFWRLARTARVRTTLLGIVVKGFYTPLMIGFFSGHANNLAEGWLRHKHLPGLKFVVPKGSALVQAGAWFDQLRLRLPDLLPAWGDLGGLFAPGAWTRADLGWGLGMAYDAVFFVDCGWALIGYSLESRWLGNKTRSVEPTVLGWAAALSCYPPYNNVLGTYLPLENGPARITDDNALLALRALTVLLFFVYATATVAFGFKFSNLTNRGVVSRGPYRLVRHPAYLCKCTAWWLEHLPTLTLTKAFFLSLLCGVYALRAWTEERHLSRDPEYRAYKQKVPWVLLPGVY
jgi:protein-S-isoprenylcysteine O-methyltransferase Ste14